MTRRAIPDTIIERAVELWCRMLSKPIFDNGDNSETGLMATAMIGQLQGDSPIPASAIENFRALLIKELRYRRDHDGEASGDADGSTIYFRTGLSCDYNPDEILSRIAVAAGVPHTAFSWKTTVWMEEDCVSVSQGYAAENIYHYPLDDGRWLICALRGSEITDVIKAVEEGRLPELTVEAAAEPVPA